MRLFERALNYVGKHGWPKENSFSEKIRKAWFVPIGGVDLIYALVKTKGHLAYDPLWSRIINALIELGENENATELLDLEDSYRHEVLEIE